MKYSVFCKLRIKNSFGRENMVTMGKMSQKLRHLPKFAQLLSTFLLKEGIWAIFVQVIRYTYSFVRYYLESWWTMIPKWEVSLKYEVLKFQRSTHNWKWKWKCLFFSQAYKCTGFCEKPKLYRQVNCGFTYLLTELVRKTTLFPYSLLNYLWCFKIPSKG